MSTVVRTSQRPQAAGRVGVVLVLAMMLAACGSDGTDSPLSAGTTQGATNDGAGAADDEAHFADIGHPDWFPTDLLPEGTTWSEAGNLGGVEGAAKAGTAQIDDPDPAAVASAVRASAVENGYELQGQNGETIVSLFRADTGSIILEFKQFEDRTSVTVLFNVGSQSGSEPAAAVTSAGTAAITLDGTQVDIAGTCTVTGSTQQFDSGDGQTSVQFVGSPSPAAFYGSHIGEVDGAMVSLSFDSATALGAQINASAQANGFVLQGPMVNQFDGGAPPFDGVVSVVCGA